MTEQRFQQLIEGPLYHESQLMHLTRLTRALKYVVDATGEAGERALEEHCGMDEGKPEPDSESNS